MLVLRHIVPSLTLAIRYQKLNAQIEKIVAEAYKVIDDEGLMPAELSEEELNKLKSEVTESTKELREHTKVLSGFEEMMPNLKGNLIIHLEPIKDRRGTGKASGSASKGEGSKRIRFKRIEINNAVEDSKGNTVWQKDADGNQKYTFTFAAKFLGKQHKGINWSPNDLTKAYLESVPDENNLPEVHTFTMPFTYKDSNGNDQTINFEIKAYR
ncbi:hypothetical protein [Streptomyces hebeiensis]